MLWEDLLFHWYSISPDTNEHSVYNYIYEVENIGNSRYKLHLLQVKKREVLKMNVLTDSVTSLPEKTIHNDSIFDLILKRKIIMKYFDEKIDIEV